MTFVEGVPPSKHFRCITQRYVLRSPITQPNIPEEQVAYRQLPRPSPLPRRRGYARLAGRWAYVSATFADSFRRWWFHLVSFSQVLCPQLSDLCRSPLPSGHASVPEVNINVYKISYLRAPRFLLKSSRRAPSSFRVCTVISTRTLELLRRYPEHIYTRPYALPTTTLRHVRRSTMVQ